MKKIVILAISAILAFNVNAQESKQECKGPKMSKEQRVEMDIKRLTQELYLSDQQAEKFALTYREFAAKADELFSRKDADAKEKRGKDLTEKEMDELAKKRFEKQKQLIELKETYYAKFRRDLNARQTAKVLRLNEHFGCKHDCCDKPHGQKRQHVQKDRKEK